MAEMQPQGAPPAEAKPASGGASKLVSDIFSQLSQLNQMIAQSQAVDDDDKQKLQAVMQGFEGFVDGLGNQKAQPAPGNTPMEAGAAKVQPAM